jgi:hypothetical protein
MMKNLIILPVLFVLLSSLAGCAQAVQQAEAAASTATPLPSPTEAPFADLTETYAVNITAADFVEVVNNPYFPLIPGTTWVYEARLEDGSTERIEHNYENGVLIDHAGAWEWGVDGALPGVIMWADPVIHLDEAYYQEYYAGEAEDMGQVLSVDESVTVPVGSFENVVQTFDFSSLDPDIQAHKFYAPGIGTVKEVELLTGEEVVLVEYAPADKVTCAPAEGATVDIATAKLYVEYNATDEDLGVHGAFDDHGWSELCVYDPNGTQVLATKPQGQLQDLTMAGIFFESREPPTDEFTFADLKTNFSEGEYSVRGVTFDGQSLVGVATFSHNIPAPAVITLPALAEDEESVGDVVVSPTKLVIEWEDVTETVEGKPVTITGYEVIITREKYDDPHGFSRPIYDVHVPGDRNSLAVPVEFLEADTLYELEVLALEESGNQTISVGFFKTE